MIRKFGFPAVVLGTVLALAAPIAGLAKDRDDYGRDNGRSYSSSFRDHERVQYNQRDQRGWNVRERRDWDRNDIQRERGIRSRGPFSNRYAVEQDCR